LTKVIGNAIEMIYSLSKTISTKDCPVKATLERVKAELLKRVDRLCATKLNAKNLFRTIDEHAISLVNHHVGVLHLKPPDFHKLDHEIRQVLNRHKVHLLPACKERLYLPREEMGRGLHNIEMRSEKMLLQLKQALKAHKYSSTRRAAILRVEEQDKTHLSLVDRYLEAKHEIQGVNKEKLEEAQRKAYTVK
jgi:hypothetical protein